MSINTRLRRIISMVSAAVVCLAASAFADAPNPVVPVVGSGSEENPWELSEVGHLVWLKDQCNNGGGVTKGVYYRLMNDLDLSETKTTWTYVPIGKTGEGNQFYGSFDGNGRTISNLYIKTSANIMGLFGVIGAQDGSTSDVCQVKNLNLTNVSVEGGDYVGGLSARNYFSTIDTCKVSGKVISNKSSGYAGGLVGYSNGDLVLDCFTSGTVTSSGDNAGGLIGCSSGSYVSDSSSTGQITGGANCGGLIGYNAPGTVENCMAFSTVSGGDNIGGLIGCNLDDVNHSIKGSVAMGSVMGTSYVGGLLGYNGTDVSDSSSQVSVIGFSEKTGGFVGGNNASIYGSACTGDVTGLDRVGGFAGESKGIIAQCSATGFVDGYDSVGGFVGANASDAKIHLSYAEGATSGSTVVGSFAGNNEGQLRQCYARGNATSADAGAAFAGGNYGIIDECYGAGLVDAVVGGGLLARNQGYISKGYWDYESTQQDTSAGDGATSKTTAEMIERVTFDEWDFLRIWVNDENTTYPYFAWSTNKGWGVLVGNIVPAAAAMDGARWTISGFAGEYIDGAVVDAIASTTYTIEFAPIEGWDTPLAKTVYLEKDSTTTVIGRYIKHGGIRVTIINPPEGAAWSVDGGTTWNVTGTIETDLSVGDYTIIFKPVSNYDTPESMTATVYEGTVTEVVCRGGYVRQTGGICVTIPDAPAGAGWSVDGGTTWNDSGTTVTDLPTGDYTIIFKPIEGYDTPTSRETTVVDDEVTEVEGDAYVRQTGGLKVTIQTTPEGAAWSIDGGTTWNASGTTLRGVPTGNYTVIFRNVTGYDTPGNISVDVPNGQIIEVEGGAYVRQKGSLKVTMKNAPDGAAWSIDDGTTWYASGNTVGSLPTGDYTVTFKPVAGYETPGSMNAFVENNKTTELTIGGYVQMVGNIRVTIPDAPDGAAWSIDGGTTWRESGEMVSGVPIGTYTVTFKPIADYRSPADLSARIVSGQTTELTSGAYEFLFDIDLLSADYTAGVSIPVVPGNYIDMRWNAKATRAVTKPFWLEIFSSKTGGFDWIQQGTAITGSHYVANGMAAEQSFVPDDLYLHPITDGLYTLIPSINRGTLGMAIPECDYVNNWGVVSQKRMMVRNPYSPSLDLSIKSAELVIDENDPTVATVRGIVKNSGPSALEKPFAWVEVFYGTLTAEAQLMKQGSIGQGQKFERLPAGAEAAFELTGRVPAGVENRALALIVDSTDIVPELDETNNVQWFYNPELLPKGKKNGIDLAITAIGVAPEQFAPVVVTAGEKLAWGVTIQNKGTIMPEGWLYLELFASQDGGVSNMRGRTITWSEQLTPPALGETKSYILEKPVNDIGNGLYSLTAIVNRTGLSDNPGDETPLDNIMTEKKGRVSLSVSSKESQKNIVWSEGPEFDYDGNQVIISGKIRNVGAATTGAFWTEAFVGTMQAKTGVFYRDIATVFARGVYCSGLASGAEQSIIISGTAEAGQVVGVLADSTDSVPETDETDNYDYSALVK